MRNSDHVMQGFYADPRIKKLEERVELAEATRDDALAYAKMYKEKVKELEKEKL